MTDTSIDPLYPDSEARLGLDYKGMFQKWGEPRPIPGIPGSAFGLVDLMGNDQAVIRAARTSYGNSVSEHQWGQPTGLDGRNPEIACKICGEVVAYDAEPAPGHCLKADRNLVRYLMRNRHSTPLEVGGEIVFYVKLPIFVERQWARHRTAGWSEMSARYVELPEEFYVPVPDRVQAQSTNNKQGSGDALDPEVAENVRRLMQNANTQSFHSYHQLLDLGVAKELARTVTSVGAYTVKVWKCDLRNLLHFSGLRLHSHAQWEIQQYAKVIGEVIRDRWPLAWEAFYDYVLHAHTFSRQEMRLLRELISHRVETERLAVESTSLGDVAFDERAFWKRHFDEFDTGSKRECAAFLAALERVL